LDSRDGWQYKADKNGDHHNHHQQLYQSKCRRFRESLSLSRGKWKLGLHGRKMEPRPAGFKPQLLLHVTASPGPNRFASRPGNPTQKREKNVSHTTTSIRKNDSKAGLPLLRDFSMRAVSL